MATHKHNLAHTVYQIPLILVLNKDTDLGINLLDIKDILDAKSVDFFTNTSKAVSMLFTKTISIGPIDMIKH